MASQRPFTIAPHLDKLLRGSPTTPVGLAQLHLATADQLCRLHYSPRSITHVKEQLKRLCDHGYVRADTVPTVRPGNPYYYTLGPRGVRYLAALGYDVRESYRAGKEQEKSWLFLAHTLELNDVLISAALLHGAATLTGFATDRTLKRKPLVVTVAGKKVSLVPDAFLSFSVPGGRQRLLIEHDRGTEGQQHFRRRIRAYLAYLREERLPVAFTTFVGAHRREQMRQWTCTELDSTGAASFGSAFWFADLARPPGPDSWFVPVWYTPYDVSPRPLLGG